MNPQRPPAFRRTTKKPHPPIQSIGDDPVAPVELLRGECHWRWWVISCPFCGRRHMHGGGVESEDPRRMLTGRLSHCHNGSYILADAYPERTVRMIDEQQRKN